MRLFDQLWEVGLTKGSRGFGLNEAQLIVADKMFATYADGQNPVTDAKAAIYPPFNAFFIEGRRGGVGYGVFYRSLTVPANRRDISWRFNVQTYPQTNQRLRIQPLELFLEIDQEGHWIDPEKAEIRLMLPDMKKEHIEAEKALFLDMLGFSFYVLNALGESGAWIAQQPYPPKLQKSRARKGKRLLTTPYVVKEPGDDF